MNRSVDFVRLATVAGALASMLVTASAWAGACDIDDYVPRAIGVEEPWLENAGYLFTQVSHNGNPQAVTLAPEVEARFSDRFGMEFDLPSYTAEEPVGRAPSAFGPLAAGLKAVGINACDGREGRAALATGEIEGQYWAHPRPQVLAGEGNSITGQLMWAELWNPWFNEGEVGYTHRIGLGITNGWFLNTSFGRNVTSVWAAQLEVEVDDQLLLADGHRGVEGSVMPQISYRPAIGWLLALGEEASFEQGTPQTGWSTWLMVEHEFSDTDDPN